MTDDKHLISMVRFDDESIKAGYYTVKAIDIHPSILKGIIPVVSKNFGYGFDIKTCVEYPGTITCPIDMTYIPSDSITDLYIWEHIIKACAIKFELNYLYVVKFDYKITDNKIQYTIIGCK